MTIAIVINTSWNIYNFRLGLIRALIANGHTVYAIAPEDPFSGLLIDEGCKFEHIPMEGTGTNPFKDSVLTYRLFMIYKKIKPDVVFHYTIKPNIYGTIAAKLLGIKVINNVSGLGTVFLKRTMSSKMALALYRFAFKFPVKVFFQNEEDKNLFIQEGLINAAKTGLVPGSGINTSYFKPEPFNRNKEFTFILIARLLKDKGIKEYAEASRYLKDKGIKARFQLLGAFDPDHKRGISEKSLAKWIRHGWIEYLGAVMDVRPYIHKADCVVLPSYREGTPRTLLEAASCAKPIVATDVVGCKNVVQHGINGLMCKVKDYKDLAKKMMQIYSLSDDDLIKMGKNGRDTVLSRFDESLVIEKYFNELEQIFPGKARILLGIKDIQPKIAV